MYTFHQENDILIYYLALKIKKINKNYKSANFLNMILCGKKQILTLSLQQLLGRKYGTYIAEALSMNLFRPPSW